ncbi:mersacidin family lantibiotic [Enterococcus sp. LJL99]
MSEKEIKNNEVAGKNLENLTEEELKALQGQGDTNAETIYIDTKTVTITLDKLSKKINCRR